MYRVLIVEDEALIREGFKRTIDWASFGLEIAAEAKDGEEGLILAQRNRPHLIFADIRMPGMDGLEFAERAAKLLPDAKIVIVSGYKDYEYFRQSLQLGLFDYLLKPVDEDELIRVVEQAVRKIEENQSDKRKAIETESRIQKSENVLHAALLCRLAEGDLSPLRESAPDPYLKTIAYGAYAVSVLRIDNFRRLARDVYAGDEEALLFTAINICEESVAKETIIFRQLGLRKQITLIRGFAKDSSSSAMAEFERGCSAIITNFGKFGRFRVSLGIGDIHEGWEGIARSYSEACLAAERTKFADGSRLVGREEGAGLASTPPLLSAEFEELFVSVCKQRDMEKAAVMLDALFRSPEAAWATRGRMYGAVERMWELADRAGRHAVAAGTPDNRQAFDKLAVRALDEPEEWLQWIMRELRERFRQGTPVYSDAKALIHDLKDYVTKEFTSEDVTLSHLSARFGMNVYQICRLFKQEFQVNFHAYLTSLKMEKAKDYLRNSSMPVQDIAYLVGFKETKYFFKVFKKHVGVTPSEYRNGRNELEQK